jgi:starch synthase
VRIAVLSREYPPDVYGGAGVHVEYLARELDRLVDLEIHCFGAPREAPASGPAKVVAYQPWERLAGDARHLSALRTISTDLAMAAGVEGADLVHSHTWYTNLAGHFGKQLYGIPHVLTVHSLEPLRPWKREQLGGGYEVSKLCERIAMESADAVVAVSAGVADDVLTCYPRVEAGRVRVIHNGIDSNQYRPDHGTDVLQRYGIDPNRPSVVFVGRITRQKGVPHLLDAAHDFDPAAQLVLCAGAPDTPELGAEVAEKVAKLQAGRSGVTWIEKMLERNEVIQLLTNATVFVCPSVYEPLGIVNLEASACGTAVVASAVGGIPEVVDDGRTGMLVPYDPHDAAAFEAGLAARIGELLEDPARAATMGAAGRERVLAEFGWPAVAQQTVEVYRRVLGVTG